MSVDAHTTPLDRTRVAMVTNKLNVRTAPSRQAQLVDRLQPGQTLTVDAVTQGEPYLGVSSWFRMAGAQRFIWSGGAQLVDDEVEPVASSQPAAVLAPPKVHRRANGTTIPLNNQQIENLFGRFDALPGAQKGAIKISPPEWREEHLTTIEPPALAAVCAGPIVVHKRARPHFEAVFDAVAAAGLQHVILTCDGTFVPRFKNWNPASGELSSHSWGIAIDLNARWNGAGRQPALPGETGCLRELVPIFVAHGFAWGGHFSSNVDGMHFELAREDP